MPKSYDRQKEAEKRILEAARRASSLFPPGDIELSERPDLRIKTPTGEIGVEVTELVRPRGNNPFPPVQDENFHQKVVRLAENYYYSRPNAQPVCVRVFFLDDEQFKRENPEGRRLLTDKRTGRKQEKMARSLAEFVKNHVPEAGPRTFKRREMAGQMEGDETLRTGFEVIAISPLPGPWRSGESATMPPLDPAQLYARIRDKGKLLPKYRKEAPDLPIWLLICSGRSVSRGVPMPPTVGQWNFPSDFDRFSYSRAWTIEFSRLAFCDHRSRKPRRRCRVGNTVRTRAPYNLRCPLTPTCRTSPRAPWSVAPLLSHLRRRLQRRN